MVFARRPVVPPAFVVMAISIQASSAAKPAYSAQLVKPAAVIAPALVVVYAISRASLVQTEHSVAMMACARLCVTKSVAMVSVPVTKTVRPVMLTVTCASVLMDPPAQHLDNVVAPMALAPQCAKILIVIIQA